MTYDIERFAPGGAPTADFAFVRGRIGYPAPEDEVPADAECLVAYDGGEPVARLAFLTAADLHGAPGPSGVVGWYEATDRDAGTALLVRARETLAERGAARVLGPMNGSAWKRYRLALGPEAGEHVPTAFLTEPVNPPEYPGHFADAGFAVVAEYETRAAPRPAEWSAGAPAAPAAFDVRPLDPDRFDDELRDAFELSLAAFAENRFYRPIGFDEFAASYRKMRPLLDPELVRLARAADGRLLGFVFAFPDPLDREGGGHPRVVLKTLATSPDARGMGVGSRLTADVHRIAFDRGAPSVIHALMSVDNTSTRISGRHHGEPFRRYALYGWSPQG